jgi:hypothetical protein
MKIKIILIILAAVVFGACNTTGREKPVPFTVDLKSPQIQVGEIEAQVDPMLAFGIKKIGFTVLYFPVEDAVCLQYKLDFQTFHQFWSRDGRDAFVAALAAYNEDYEARNLNDKAGRREKRKYGSAQGYLAWQMFSFSVMAKANMEVELGYTFDSRNPYFCVNQREANYEDPVSRDNNRTSTVTPFLYTRAQAQELANLFDQGFLDGLVVPGNRSRSASYDEY